MIVRRRIDPDSCFRKPTVCPASSTSLEAVVPFLQPCLMPFGVTNTVQFGAWSPPGSLSTQLRISEAESWDVTPERHILLMRSLCAIAKARSLTWALAALLGLCFGPDARADLNLDISSLVGASVEFKGSGTGSTFTFDNNGSGNGFGITSSTGVGDSVGLLGSISGTFSYTKASIVTLGPLQMAPASTSGGLLTITDSSLHSLTATITGVDVDTVGTGGSVNVDGAINLSNVVYTGTNADLVELRNEVNSSGGVASISFQFLPAESLTQLTANHSDHKTSYSGTIITTSVPEPSSLVLGCTAALGLFGYGLRRRRAPGA